MVRLARLTSTKIIRSSKDLIDTYHMRIPDNLLSSLLELLARGPRLFAELEKVVDHSLIRHRSSGQIKVSKVGLTIKSSRVATLRSRLKDVKFSLGNLLNAISL